MSAGIQKLTMPKWGLSMREGKVGDWLVEEGTEVQPGIEVVEIETEKIASALEASQAGILRRKVAKPGQVVPVAGLVAVIADASVPDSEIDAFIADFQATFVPEEAEEEIAGPKPEMEEVYGQTLRYLRRGEGGEPAILIHGFGGDLNNWLFNHESLSANRAVYALDLPGHGGSSKKKRLSPRQSATASSLMKPPSVVALKSGITAMRIRPEVWPRFSTATSTRAARRPLSWRLPRSPAWEPPIHVSSTSTAPWSGSRAALTVARRNLCSIIQAVS